MSRTRIFWILISIVMIGIAFRSFQLTGRSMWFDEAFSWRLIQFPFSEMIARDAADVHPPLYYIVLQGWAYVFGSSLFAIRSFSVASAAVSLVGAYLFAAYAFRSKRAGIYAATVLALSPWAISYGWEARMYPLGMVFAVFSSFALLHGLREKSFWWFGAYGVLAAALAYTHYFGFFTIASHALFVLAVLVKSTRWRIGELMHAKIFWASILAACFALLLYVPWIPTFLEQRAQVQASYWVPPLSITSVPDTFYQLFVPSTGLVPHHGYILIVSLFPLAGTLLLWAYSIVRFKKSDGVWFTVVLAVIPMLFAIVISLGGRSLYNDRFFAFTGIFILILLAYVVSTIKRPIVRRVVFIGTIVALIFSFTQYWNDLDIKNKGGSHAATRYTFTHRENGDKILVSSPFIYFAVLHYATEEFDAKDVPRLYSDTGELSHFSGGPILMQADIAGPLDIVGYTKTVWVIDTTGFGEEEFIAPSNWTEQSRETFPEVFTYQGDIIVREFTIHL